MAHAYALSKTAAMLTQGRVDGRLEESTAVFHRDLGAELPVPAEIAEAFGSSAPLLSLARMAVPASVPVPRPSANFALAHAQLRAAA